MANAHRKLNGKHFNTLLCDRDCPHWNDKNPTHVMICTCRKCSHTEAICGHCLDADRIVDCYECSLGNDLRTGHGLN